MGEGGQKTRVASGNLRLINRTQLQSVMPGVKNLGNRLDRYECGMVVVVMERRRKGLCLDGQKGGTRNTLERRRGGGGPGLGGLTLFLNN